MNVIPVQNVNSGTEGLKVIEPKLIFADFKPLKAGNCLLPVHCYISSDSQLLGF